MSFLDFDTVLYKTVHFIIGLSIPIDCTDVKSQLIGKDPDAGKNWRQKEKRVAEDEMVR